MMVVTFVSIKPGWCSRLQIHAGTPKDAGSTPSDEGDAKRIDYAAGAHGDRVPRGSGPGRRGSTCAATRTARDDLAVELLRVERDVRAGRLVLAEGRHRADQPGATDEVYLPPVDTAEP